MNLPTLVEYIDPSALIMLARRLQNADAFLTKIDSFDTRDLSGIISRIALLAEIDVGHLFSELEYSIRLDHVLREPGVTIFSLDSLRYPEFARFFGRLVINDLKAISSRYGQFGIGQALTIFDEFNVFDSIQVVDFINKSQSAGFEAVIGTPSLDDLDVADPSLRRQIIQNRNTITRDAAELAATIGTEDTYGVAYQVNAEAFGGQTGRGSMSTTKEYIVHPDEIKRLKMGEAIILRKVPEFLLQRTKVRRIEI